MKLSDFFVAKKKTKNQQEFDGITDKVPQAAVKVWCIRTGQSCPDNTPVNSGSLMSSVPHLSRRVLEEGDFYLKQC